MPTIRSMNRLPASVGYQLGIDLLDEEETDRIDYGEEMEEPQDEEKAST